MRWRLVTAVLLVLTGCSQTETAPTTTLAPLTIGALPAAATSTTVAPSVEGYVNAVLDGVNFTYTVGPGSPQPTKLAQVSVPDVSTCEGLEARNLLASIIAGHKVRIDPDGSVWKDDIDVALAMVNFGYAKSAGERYQAADTQSVDFSCAATTTVTLAPVVVVPPVQQPKPKPKPTVPKPKRTTPPATDAPVETDAPPVARPPATEPPEETQPEPEATLIKEKGKPPGVDNPPKHSKPPKDTKKPKR